MNKNIIDRIINDHNETTGDLLHVVKHFGGGYTIVLGCKGLITCDNERQAFFAAAAIRNYAKIKGV